jgi:hypothetical protein
VPRRRRRCAACATALDLEVEPVAHLMNTSDRHTFQPDEGYRGPASAVLPAPRSQPPQSLQGQRISVLSPSTPAVQQDPKMHPSADGGAGCPGGCGPWRHVMRASQEEAVVGVEQWAEIPRMHSWRGCRSRRSRGELAAIATRCGALCGRGSRRAMSGGRGRRSWIPSARRSTGCCAKIARCPGRYPRAPAGDRLCGRQDDHGRLPARDPADRLAAADVPAHGLSAGRVCQFDLWEPSD